MNNLNELLQKIKNNPVLYLGQPSLTCLDSFLSGYLSTRFDLGIERENIIFDDFQKWMQKKEKNKENHSWARIILFYNIGERSAFYNFFKSFEQFLREDENSKIQKDERETKLNVGDSIARKRTLYELLEGIKKRPAMYLGTSSITRLDMLLRGFHLARREVGIPPTQQEREFESFQSWIEEKYGIKSGQSWSKIILFYSIDEQDALDKFFELFEEFLNRDKSLELIAEKHH